MKHFSAVRTLNVLNNTRLKVVNFSVTILTKSVDEFIWLGTGPSQIHRFGTHYSIYLRTITLVDRSSLARVGVGVFHCY